MRTLTDWLSAPGNSQSKLARAIGVSQTLVSYWVRSGRIPARRLRAVSRVTGLPVEALLPSDRAA